MKKVFVFLLILISFSLVTCLTVDAYVQAQLEGVPLWVYEYKANPSQEVFMVKFIPTLKEKANGLDLIVEKLILEVENRIGYYLTGEEKKELKTTREIDSIGLVIKEEFIKKKADESVVIYLLATCDKDLVKEREQKNSDINIKNTQREKELIQDARNLYRENKDLEAATIYLKLGNLTGKTEYYDKVNSIIKRVDISVKAKTFSSFDVQVSRSSSWVASPIAKANILFTSPSFSNTGFKYLEKVTSSTDKEGFIEFNFINQLQEKNGYIQVSLDFPTKNIKDLNAKKEIEKTLESKIVKINYSLPDVSIDYDVRQYSILGDLTYSTSSFLGFKELASYLDVETYLSREKRNSRYLVKGEVGITEVTFNKGDYITSVRGSAKVIDNKTNKVIYDTETFESMGIAKTKEDSISRAFKRFGNMLFTVVKPYVI